MTIGIRKLGSGYLVPLLLAAGCSGTDTASVSTALVDRVTAAMGGSASVMAATSETVEATGQRYDLSEAPRAGENLHVADFSYVRTAELGSRSVHHDLVNKTDFLVPGEYKYSEILSDGRGYVKGQDGLSVVPDQTVTSFMPPSRITAHLQHLDLISPLRLVRRALAHPEAVREEDAVLDGRTYKVLRLAEPGETPLRLIIDPTTFLPAKVEMTEDHAPLGDSSVQAIYSDYRDVSGVKLPYKVTLTMDGKDIHTEERTRVALSESPEAGHYEVPEEQNQPIYPPALAEYGKRSAELLVGLQLMSLPFFYTSGLLDSGQPLTLNELSPGVNLLVGESHHELLIEMSDYLILVDAPTSEARSEKRLAAIKQRYPKKPIKFIVASHFHYDHMGGIRRYAAEGGLTLLAGTPSVGFFKHVFENPHTVQPDRFSANPVPVEIKGVDTHETLTDGSRVVEIYRIKSSHAEDMVIVYLPAEKVLFNADLFNPGQWPTGAPSPGYFGRAAGELYDEAVVRLGLEVKKIVGSHGDGSTATVADLMAARSL